MGIPKQPLGQFPWLYLFEKEESHGVEDVGLRSEERISWAPWGLWATTPHLTPASPTPSETSEVLAKAMLFLANPQSKYLP